MTAPSTTTRPPIKLDPVGTLAHKQISDLQRAYLADRPTAVAALARLRRGAGKNPMAVPDLWGLIDTTALHDAGLSVWELEQAENALYVALPLWALHQQARGDGMHVREHGRELGAAVRKLMLELDNSGEINEPIRKRLVRAGNAASLPILAVRLREIVLLLRQESVALDYALLTDQLCRWQRTTERDRVRRAWGRSFHTRAKDPSLDPGSTTELSTATDPKDAE